MTAEVGYRFCGSCGKKFREGCRVCPYCGKSIYVKTPKKPPLTLSGIYVIQENLNPIPFWKRTDAIDIIMIGGSRSWNIPVIVGGTYCDSCESNEIHIIRRWFTSYNVNIIPVGDSYGGWSIECHTCKKKFELSKEEVLPILMQANLIPSDKKIITT